MDATIKGKLNFYNKQNQMLAKTAGDATNYYNTIIQTKYDNIFWQKAGLVGGTGALLVKGIIPSLPSIALPETIATTAATGAGSTALATTTAAATTGTELELAGVIATLDGAEVLTGAAEAAAMANVGTDLGLSAATTVSVGSSSAAATGAAAAGGGAAISAALPYVVAGIAAYIVGKSVGELAGQYIYYKQGKQQLEELSSNVTLLKTYCNIMRSQIASALNNLSAASICISDAEKRIAKQHYKTKDKNLKKIRERQAEVKSMYSSLQATKSIVDIVYNNLNLIA